MSLSIPQELVEQLKSGNVVLFCGAGISASKGGLPSGRQLAQELAKRAGEPELVNAPLPEAAQAYKLKLGLHSLIAYVADRIDDPRYTPLRTHQLIAALPFTKIITTNWDNLLEKALDQAGKPCHKIVRDPHVAFVDEAKVLLVKLHGSVEQKDSIIITEDDYYDVCARLPMTANLVRNFFATKTILFLGFGLADDDFKRLYREVTRHIGIHKRRAYAVQLDIDELTAKYWEEQNVQIIAADATAFLEALADALGTITPTPRVARQPRRVDAALPSQAEVGQSIDLVIAVKLPESPMLDAREIRGARISQGFPDDAKPESTPIIIKFPVDERTKQTEPATLEIQVVAPCFKVHGSTRKALFVPPDEDSDLCKFSLTPLKRGNQEVTVEFYSQRILIGTVSLETVVHPESVIIDRRSVVWVLVTLPLVLIVAPGGGKALTFSQPYPAEPPTRHRIHFEDLKAESKEQERLEMNMTDTYDATTLRRFIVDHFNLEDLDILCQDLNVRFDSVPGTTLEGKAGGLIVYLQHRGRQKDLTAALKKARPIPWQEMEEAQKEEQLAKFYRQGIACFRNRDWAQAIDLFQQILEIDEDYKDTSSLLAEAKKQKKLVELYDQAMAYFRGGDWTQAANLFRQILQIDKDYKDALQRLTQAEKQQHLEQFYARVRQAEADKEWPRMITLCREIIDIAPYYRDVQLLLQKARLHSVLQQVKGLGAQPMIRVLVLIVLLLGVAMGIWIPVSGKLSPIVWPLAPTPTIPPVKVEAFLVTRGAEMITTRPGTEITVTVGETVTVTVEVSTTAEEARTTLEFSWYTCRKENGPVLRAVGNPKMFYIAPSEPGPDCICVAVEKGGTRLDRQRIFVDIQQ